MIIGWWAYLVAWAMNILFYKFHPSRVDTTCAGLREKCFLYVWGHKMVFLQWSSEDSDERENIHAGEEETSFTNTEVYYFYVLYYCQTNILGLYFCQPGLI